MKTLGIVAEYNPFHNGHKYHLETSKALCGADAAVCVMSGNFIQRGEPAMLDKWARAEMALSNGIDLVIELPLVYAMSSAEYFAFGAVRILDAIGIIDSISFGSEAGSIEILDKIASVLLSEPDDYKVMLKEALAKGQSFPAARQSALEGCFEKYPSDNLENNSSDNIKISEIMCCSNNILGIEYIKALKKLGSKIKPFTISRIANNYNSEEISGTIASATAIRKQIVLSKSFVSKCDDFVLSSCRDNVTTIFEKIRSTIPSKAFAVIEREFELGRGPVFPSDFGGVILSMLRLMNTEDIKTLPYVAEGLENRIKSAAEASGTLDELMEGIGTKRYTKTRIQRCIFSLLSGLRKDEFKVFNDNGGPQYARILGFNETGRRLLSEMNKKSTLPVIVKTADFSNDTNPLLSRMLKLEAVSTDQYVLAFKNKAYRKSGQEFTRNIILH